MTEFSQKSIVKVLDHAANRAASRDQIPATSKQTWYLAGLLFQAGEAIADMETEDFIIGGRSLTKRDASDLIEIHAKKAA